MTREVVYTEHALQRMVLRRISHREVEEAIHLGSKNRQDGRIVATYRYFDVIYAIRRERCFVITVKPRW